MVSAQPTHNQLVRLGHGSHATTAPARGWQPGLWWHWSCMVEAAIQGQQHCTAAWRSPGEPLPSPAGSHAEFPVLAAFWYTAMCLIALSCHSTSEHSFQCSYPQFRACLYEWCFNSSEYQSPREHARDQGPMQTACHSLHVVSWEDTSNKRI